jgi:hypothetical protein
MLLVESANDSGLLIGGTYEEVHLKTPSIFTVLREKKLKNGN